MIINEAGLKQYVKDCGNGRQVSKEYRLKLEGKIRYLVRESMGWPQNKKVLKDFI